MEFIQELHEARLTRQASGLKTLTYTDCCERAYLTMLIMEVLRRFPNTAPYAHGYAKKTSGYDNYKHFRMSGTDLYNFVYFIVGDEDALDKLNPEQIEMIFPYIDPDFWKRKFVDFFADTEWVKHILKEAGL